MGRYDQIIEVIKNNPGLTDIQIQELIKTININTVRIYLKELLMADKIERLSKKVESKNYCVSIWYIK